jgi:hypothetical protein
MLRNDAMAFRKIFKKPQDLSDFELRNPENPQKSHLLGDFELRNHGMPKKSCFLNGCY